MLGQRGDEPFDAVLGRDHVDFESRIPWAASAVAGPMHATVVGTERSPSSAVKEVTVEGGREGDHVGPRRRAELVRAVAVRRLVSATVR